MIKVDGVEQLITSQGEAPIAYRRPMDRNFGGAVTPATRSCRGR